MYNVLYIYIYILKAGILGTNKTRTLEEYGALLLRNQVNNNVVLLAQ